MQIWVLTKEYNDYDQYGEYYERAYKDKPHHSELTKRGVPTNRLRHVLNGGGQFDDRERYWFHLREHEID